QLGPRPHHLVPRPDHRQVPLRLLAPVPDRIDQLHVRSPLPRQKPRIQPVVLLLPPPAIHPARIPDHHLVPQHLQLPRHPRRVRARLQHHPAPLPAPEVLPQPRPRRHHTPPSHLPPSPVHLAHLAHPIAKIQPHRYLGKQLRATSHRRPPAPGPSGPSTVNFPGEQYSTLRRDRPEVGLLISTPRSMRAIVKGRAPPGRTPSLFSFGDQPRSLIGPRAFRGRGLGVLLARRRSLLPHRSSLVRASGSRGPTASADRILKA